MITRELAIIALNAMVVISALYAPQPLLPVLTKEFSLSSSQAALLMTLALFPLSIAPIVYGFLLESFPTRKLLRIAVGLLSLTELFFFFSKSFVTLIVIRLAQGFLIPAILTSLTTHISGVTKNASIQRIMAFYIAATILGGFLGRACSGFLSVYLGWRYSFLVLSVSLMACFFMLGKLKADSRIHLSRLNPWLVLEVLRNRQFLRLYVIVFLAFFAFTSVLNFLPFRLTEIAQDFSEFKIGLMYAGYMMGMIVSLNAVRIVGLFRGEIRTIIAGLSLFALSILLFSVASIPVIFAAMFILCGGMFLVHSVALGFLNKTAQDKFAVANGLYISFYYAGGTVGSYFPGLVYHHFGWSSFVLSLSCVLVLGIVTAYSYRRAEQTP